MPSSSKPKTSKYYYSRVAEDLRDDCSGSVSNRSTQVGAWAMLLVSIVDASFVYFQLAKTVQTNAEGISLPAYGTLCITSVLWFWWGARNNDKPIMLGSVLVFLGALSLVSVIIHCRRMMMN